jgi:hypothetical protein
VYKTKEAFTEISINNIVKNQDGTFDCVVMIPKNHFKGKGKPRVHQINRDGKIAGMVIFKNFTSSRIWWWKISITNLHEEAIIGYGKEEAPTFLSGIVAPSQHYQPSVGTNMSSIQAKWLVGTDNSAREWLRSTQGETELYGMPWSEVTSLLPTAETYSFFVLNTKKSEVINDEQEEWTEIFYFNGNYWPILSLPELIEKNKI